MTVSAVNRLSTCSKIRDVALYPYRQTVKLIQFVVQKFFGWLLRLSVFQLGEYKRPFSYFVMRLFQVVNSDPRERDGINRDRLEESKTLLLSFGGIESVAHPTDGGAQIRYMSFTPERAFARIAEMGGEVKRIHWRNSEGQIEPREAVFQRPNTTPERFNRLVKDLKKFGLPVHDELQDVNGTIQRGVLLPLAPEGNDDIAILRLHSPGRGMLMDRKFLRWVFAGCSAYIMDPRGTLDSTGTPSEGGYYLDAEAVFQKILGDGYEHEEIYVSGYCEGAAIGAHLIEKYHHLGVHFIAENPFNTLYDMVKGFNVFGKWTADYIFPEIQTTAPSITSRVRQDGFNNERKLTGLRNSTGKFILVHSHVDRTNPPHSIENLQRAIGEHAGPVLVHQRIHPNPKFDAHMQPPSEAEATWRWMVEAMNS